MFPGGQNHHPPPPIKNHWSETVGSKPPWLGLVCVLMMTTKVALISPSLPHLPSLFLFSHSLLCFSSHSKSEHFCWSPTFIFSVWSFLPACSHDCVCLFHLTLAVLILARVNLSRSLAVCTCCRADP